MMSPGKNISHNLKRRRRFPWLVIAATLRTNPRRHEASHVGMYKEEEKLHVRPSLVSSARSDGTEAQRRGIS